MKNPVLTLAVGLALGALCVSDASTAALGRVFGAFASHQTEELYDISVGVTAAGNDVREQRHRELRETVVVPAHYGSVVAVTPTSDGDGAVIWYQGTDGVVRNVILSEPDRRLYGLELRPGSRREVRLLR